MADSFEIDLNVQDLLLDLQALPQTIQTRVMKGAVATGASVIRKEAIRLAPTYTGDVADGHPPPGTLKKAIYQTRLPSQCTPTQEVWKVDVRRGKAARNTRRGKGVANLDAFYAKWVEFGHYTRVPHAMTKTAKAAGRALGVARYVPPHPFMRPAVQAKAGEAFKAMQTYIYQQLPLATAALRIVRAT
jgi:HK97 gp10 family phage protein